jgi:FAD/FMN-containing dehydrogenase
VKGNAGGSSPTLDPALERTLRAIVGDEHVLTDDLDRSFFSQDVYRQAEVPAACVIQPGSPEELARAVAAVTGARHAVIPRGGGASYTGGYLPDRAESVIVDTRRMRRVLEVSTEDMYVTVECGCTWKELDHALHERKVRTPFWGPLSGAYATVGGGLSQNSILWGSSLYGTSAESVLGLEVVVADGTLLPTGSAATTGSKPFFRHYGPDLTGLFLGDTGALGIKARATLRLIPRPEAVRFASFAHRSREALVEAMASIARSGLASECYGMDPHLQRQRMKRTTLAKDLGALRGVAASAGSRVEGVREAVRVMVAGRRFVEEDEYSLHVGVEGPAEETVTASLEAVRRLGSRGGREIENTIPKVLRGEPFLSMSSGIGPQGERWAPVHGVLPLSGARRAWSEIQELVEERRADLDRHGVVVGFLVATVSTNAFVLEPVFYWPGPRTLFYERTLEPADLARFEDFPRDPEAESLVSELRSECVRRFLELGAAHLQIGRTYPFRESRDPATWRLLEALKRAVDPEGLMNPGSLGLS